MRKDVYERKDPPVHDRPLRHRRPEPVLNIASLVLVLAYILTRLPLLLYVGVVLLGFCYYRMFSRNISKRTEENYRYYAVKDRIRSKFSSLRDQWNNRKLYHYYRCPSAARSCGCPGRGRIQISCPRCGTQFIKKS